MGIVDVVALVLLVEMLVGLVLCTRYRVHLRYTPRRSWLDDEPTREEGPFRG